MTLRAPLVIQQNRAAPAQHEFARTNLLETTLLSKDALPFRQSDWQLPPRGYEFPVANRFHAWNGLEHTLLSKDALPFRQQDWLVPKVAEFPIELRTFLNPVELQLIGKDQFFGAPGQVQDYDWQNPQATIPSDRSAVWQAPLPLLNPAPPPPPPPDDVVKTGAGGLDPGEGEKRRAYKPTGLRDAKTETRTQVQDRLDDSQAISAEIAGRLAREFTEEGEAARQENIALMTEAQVSWEIGLLLRKKMRTEEDELLLLLLLAASAA